MFKKLTALLLATIFLIMPTIPAFAMTTDSTDPTQEQKGFKVYSIEELFHIIATEWNPDEMQYIYICTESISPEELALALSRQRGLGTLAVMTRIALVVGGPLVAYAVGSIIDGFIIFTTGQSASAWASQAMAWGLQQFNRGVRGETWWPNVPRIAFREENLEIVTLAA